MALENERVKDTKSATKEANDDAVAIKSAGSPEESYKKFKTELNDIEQTVTDKTLRDQYRNDLTKAMGKDLNLIMVEYLKDPENGAKLRNEKGEITARSVDTRALALSSGRREGSELDKTLLPELSLAFDDIRNADKNDRGAINADNITQKDLTAYRQSYDSKVLQDNSIAANKADGYADVLLDPKNTLAFTNAEKTFFSGEDGRMSQSNIDSYVKDAAAYKGADKDGRYPPDFVAKLEQISKHWNAPQMNAMKDANGYLTRDSIAKGCGFENQQAYLDAKKQNPEITKGNETSKENKFDTVVYGDTIRTFESDKNSKLVAFTEAKNGTTSRFSVDEKGDIRDSSNKVVGTNARFDPSDKSFTHDDKKEVPTNVKAETSESEKDGIKPNVEFKYPNNMTRTFQVENGKVTGFTENDGKTEAVYKVDKDGNASVFGDKDNKVVRTKVELQKDGKFTFVQDGKSETAIAEVKPEAEQKQTDANLEKLAASSKQSPKQGYWDVANKMLADPLKGQNETAQEVSAQNVILMRALQAQNKGGKLGGHEFVKSEDDVKALVANVESYVKAHPQFKDSGSRLVAKLKPFVKSA